MPSPSISRAERARRAAAPAPGADPAEAAGLDLRPRSPSELYDAAWTLLRARPALLLPLGGLHLLPFAVALGALILLPGRAWSIDGASLPTLALALLAAAAVALRPLALGAVALAVAALVRGEEPLAGHCLGGALARARAIADVAAFALLVDLGTAGLLRVGGARHALVPLVVLDRREPAAARAEAARLGQTHTRARLEVNGHGLLLFVVTLVNLWAGAVLVIEVGRFLLGLDLAVARDFVSFQNPPFAALVAVAAGLALEPLRAVVKSLLFLDCRLREEGSDLKLRLERLA